MWNTTSWTRRSGAVGRLGVTPPPRAAAAPRPASWEVCLSAGQRLLRSGEFGPLWRVVEGWVVLTHDALDDRQVLGLVGPGELVGLAALRAQPYDADATALLPARLCPEAGRVSSEQLCMVALTQQVRDARLMASLRTGTVRRRLLCLLEHLRAHGQPMDRKHLPVLKELARLVDATVETVCRTLPEVVAELAATGTEVALTPPLLRVDRVPVPGHAH